MDSFDVLKLILASFGGATVALLGLSKWLGTVWANRILEREKAKNNLELEEYKAQLKLEADKMSRYIESQFSLYNSLWEVLYNLKVAGDSLWEDASLKNLKHFATQLTQVEEMIQKRSLLIEDTHQRELVLLIEAFDNFRLGKEKLITLRKYGYSRLTKWSLNDMDHQIQHQVEDNRHLRDQYNNLADKIQISLRNQLKSNSPLRGSQAMQNARLSLD